MEGYELIICEKPNAAEKVAKALADGKASKKSEKKISYYEISHKGKNIIVAAAVGHLFTLAEKDKKAWSYPIFNYEWRASYEVNKASKFTKPYADTIKKLAKDASEFTVATDFDIEGSTIGFNIIRFLCNKKDARRMKFSTLTEDELVESYEHASPHLDFPQIESGVTRHSLDWIWGLNLSRALTLSIKNATSTFKLLSTGRVQGPTLKLLYEREKEIGKFKPTPYWELELQGKTNNDEKISAWHKQGKFLEKERASSILKNCKNKGAIVADVKAKEFVQKPPFPFDLTSLQIEAYGVLGLSPQRTLDMAQELYTNSLISYPRTSSQKLPESIGYRKILQKLSKQFPEECSNLLSKQKLFPNNGLKDDAAHPALFPTGESPKGIDERTYLLYELIARRFFATFGENAVRETMTVVIDVNNEPFITTGTTTKERGWHALYGRFLRLKEEELPRLNVKDEISGAIIKLHDKETKPPARYNEASIIKAMESVNIGTKATRSTVLQNLYDRNYIADKLIRVTDLGTRTIETLEKYCPEVLDAALTRKFEEDMESIQEGKKKGDEIIEEARGFLKDALDHFKKNEKEIGKELGQAVQETRDKESFIGKCPVCKEGDLQMRRGKYGIFAACNRYEKGCSTTFALPKNALVKGAEKDCEVCSYPKILVIKARRKPQELCINPNCESKKQEEEKMKELVKDKKCPHCSSQLVIKSSVYGSFLACPGYPKCRHIEKIKKTD